MEDEDDRTTREAQATELLAHAEVCAPNSGSKDALQETQGMTGSEKNVRGATLLMQVLAAITAGWTQINSGAIVVLSGAILPQLTNINTSDIYFDDSNAAFFSSSPNMGGVAGCLISGVMMVALGQRITLLVTLPVCLASWLAISFTDVIIVVQVMRVVHGVCLGILTVAPHAYVAEFADKRYRGTLDGIITFVRSGGIFLPFGLAAASMYWRHVTLVCGIVGSVPPLLGLLFFPNSPRWLASNKRYEEAERALKFFRGQECDISDEMEEIKITVENSRAQPTLKSQLLHLRDWSLLKRLLVLAFTVFASQWSGYLAIFSYALNIFGSVVEGLDPSLCTIILGIVRSLTSVTYIIVIERISRRKVLLVSFLCGAVNMACMGAYFYIQLEVDSPAFLTNFSFLPLVFALLQIFCVFYGVTIVLLMKLETLPVAFRSLGSGFIDSFAYFSIFIMVYAFPYMNKALQPYGTFWVYAGWCLIAAFVSTSFLPETRGKTLELIELKSKTTK
ncbi:facilitated trehalose transporter Tret1-2 homolog [Oratosquilla oratoria]|uniref:facilitated trehalose transporter Tret1-2 homolog n=1 Tax=Oratosquilla oratoria TaxID=337810 RepID=UPI003F772B75